MVVMSSFHPSVGIDRPPFRWVLHWWLVDDGSDALVSSDEGIDHLIVGW